jgi:hypothetical protein
MTWPRSYDVIMTLDLTDDEALALAQLLRRTIDDDRYPMTPRLAPFKAISAKLDPPKPLPATPPPLRGRYGTLRGQASATGMKPYRGPPMTLGNAAAATVRLIGWCRDCGRQVEPDPGEMAERHGAETTVLDWHARLALSGCGGPAG